MQANNDYCRRKQWEYTELLDDAYRDRELHGGQYTKAGVKLLVKAAIAQRELADHTTGATSSAHREEYNRLSRLIHAESERLGVIQPPPPAQTAVPPAANRAPAASDASVNRKTGKGNPLDEVGESFNLEDFVLKPGELTLDDVRLEATMLQRLRDAIDPFDPLTQFPKATRGWKPRPRSNFLFFGPPGTGKSHLCMAINGSMARCYPGERSVFYLIDGNKLVSKWRGSTGHRLDMIFQEAEKREFSVICIDEFEQLCPDRAKVEDRESYTKNFLTLMEGVGGRTSAMVIACTNHPQLLDPAILSRLQNRLFIDYPDEDDIFHYFMDNAEYVDYLGKSREAAEASGRALAKAAAARRFSYRNLGTVTMRLGQAVVRKTRETYPNGNPELERMCAVSADEAMAILEGVDTDFDAKQYALYQDYLEKKGIP